MRSMGAPTNTPVEPCSALPHAMSLEANKFCIPKKLPKYMPNFFRYAEEVDGKNYSRPVSLLERHWENYSSLGKQRKSKKDQAAGQDGGAGDGNEPVGSAHASGEAGEAGDANPDLLEMSEAVTSLQKDVRKHFQRIQARIQRLQEQAQDPGSAHDVAALKKEIDTLQAALQDRLTYQLSLVGNLGAAGDDAGEEE